MNTLPNFRDSFDLKKTETTQFEDEGYFLLIDVNLQIITFNKAFTKILKTKNKNRSSNLMDCIDALHKHWFLFLFETAKKGKCVQQEILIFDERKNLHWVRFDVSPSYNMKNEISGITFIGKNIDKEKSQEEKIEMQKLLLREIAFTYSHELRHPLTNILAVINLLKNDNLKMTQLYFECIEVASKKMDEVIKTVAMQLYNAA